MLEDRVRHLTEGPVNPFHKKRLRRELLERASGGAAAAPRRGRVAALVCFAAVAAAVAFFLLGRASVPPSGVVITATSGTFSEEVRGDVRRVALTDGDFEFDVNHQPGTPRLLVVVPDGEIEDIGTRFEVSVREQRTVSIRVTEGEVEFRRVGEAPLRLIAGMTFRAVGPSPSTADAKPAEPTAQASSPTATATPVPPPAGPSVALSPPRVSPSAAPPLRMAIASPSAPSIPRTVTTAPSPAATEDTLYLAILRADDRGDAAAARDLAMKYLADHPGGFRRSEVEALLARVKNSGPSGRSDPPR